MKSTKKALLLSMMSMLLCVAMLMGTTFAWFTDSVTSGKNRITAGNLDIELYHSNNKVTNKTVEAETELFPVALWEPGVISYENFTVKNVGTLAFKYTMVLSKWNFNTVKDTDKSLADVIKVAIVPGGYTPATSGDPRAALLADSNITFGSLIQEGTNDIYKIDSDTTGMGILYPADNTPDGGKTSETFGVILYWEPSEIDNDYNLNNGKKSSDGEPLFLDLGINLLATQYTYETDSFDNQYDKDTVLPIIGTKTQTVKKSAEGTYTFENDKYVEGEQQKQAPATVIPSGTTFYTSHDKSDDNKVEEAAGENVTGELNRKVETSKEYIEEEQKTVINLDISFTYTTKTTTASGTTEDTQDVKAFSNIVEYSAPIGKGFALQTVTHNGVAMTEAANMTAKADQTYYYDYNTGILYVWSSTFSVFEAIGVDCVAFISRDGKMVPFDTLLDAFNDMKDGETVVLMADLTEQNVWWSPKAGNYTLDLNGNKIEGKKLYDPTYTLRVYGQAGTNVTITDSSDHPGSIIGYGDAPYLEPNDGHSMNGTLYIRTQNSGDHMNVTLENVNIVSVKGECAINSEITSGKESLVVKSGKIDGDIYLNLRDGRYVVSTVFDCVDYTGETKVITPNPSYKLKTTSESGKTTYGIEVELDCDLYLSDPYLQTSGEYSVCNVSGGNLILNMSAGSSNNPAFKNIKVYRDFTANSYFSITAGEYSVPCITTFDINGKTVTANNGLTFSSNTSTKYAPPNTSDYRNRITICDTVGGGKIIAKNSSIYVNSVELIINGGVFDIKQFQIGTASGSNRAKGVVTINGGNFTVSTAYVETLKTFVTSGSTVTINGESYTAPQAE